MNAIQEQDFYPSRQGVEDTITDRKDPVVYGTAADGPLSQDELDAYDRNGFLFYPGFFDADDLASFKTELDRLWKAAATDSGDEVIREPESEIVRSIFRVHETSDVYRALAADPRLADRARQLLGSDVYIHQSRINYKPGFKGKEFYWHSDFETWHVEDGVPRMRMVSCAIWLTENNPVNGPVMVMPGSHKWFVGCSGGTPDDHFKASLRRQEFGVPSNGSMEWLEQRCGIEQPIGPAGSVLFFECNVIHGSNGNITPYPRSNVFMVYNSVENTPKQAFGPARRRPHFLGSSDFTPLPRR